MFAALICACTGDTSSTDPGTASIVLPAGRVELSAVKGDSATRTFTIGSTGPSVSWTASADVPWLTIRPTSGTTPATVSVTTRTTDLAPGRHVGNVSVRTTDAPDRPYTLPVELQVAPAPVLALSPTSFIFSGVRGQMAAATQSLSVDITDGPTAPWTISSSAPWLTVSPSSGTGSGQAVVRVDPAGLGAGSHSATLMVLAPTAGNSPQSVPVSLSLVQQHTITVTASPSEQGSVSGAGTFVAGQTATLVATPAAGAEFVNWSESGAIVSTSATYAFTVNADRSLTANFRSSTVTISVTPSPANGGTASGGGQVARGASVTVTATPLVGFTFVNWTENGALISTDRVYTFTATASRSLVANFATAQSGTVTIATSSNPAAAGTTTGASSYPSGSSVTVSATAATGYAFSNWTENGTVMATTPSYSFVASANRALVANFTPTSGAATYTVATQSSPAAGGTTSGGGSYSSGATATVVATPASGYSFTNWTENGTVVSTTASYSFAATANRTLVANFAAVQTTMYTVGTQSSPAAGGTTSGGGTFASGTTVTVMATAATGYSFASWTENGTVVSTTPGYSFVASAHRTLVAVFTAAAPSSYTIATQATPTAGGATSGGGTFAPGASVTVTATPASGYTFLSWTENGTTVSTNTSYTFPATANRTLVANFTTGTATRFSVATGNRPGNGGTAAGDGFYMAGSMVTVTATPTTGFYTFTNWTEHGVVVSTSPNYSFAISKSRELVANFTPVPGPVVISVSTSPTNAATFSGAVSYQAGAPVNLSVVGAPGFYFDRWVENGEIINGLNPYNFTATTSRSLVATFKTTQEQGIHISVFAQNDWGTVTGNNSGPAIGTQVTVTATPNPGYVFHKWAWSSGLLLSTSAVYTFTALYSTPGVLVAHFLPAPQGSVTISATPSPAAGGTTAGQGMYLPGASVTVLATPKASYTFASWTENGTVVSTSPSYTFVAGTANRTLVANFTPPPTVTITAAANPTAGGRTSGAGTYIKGSAAVTLSATANAGYDFVNWTENGAVVSTQSSMSVPTTNDRNLVANFAVGGPSVSILTPPTVNKGDSLVVPRVDARGVYAISSVRATVNDRSVQLVFNGAYWGGYLSLAGLPYGPLTVVVQATDSQGGVGMAQAAFSHNLPPVVTVNAPAELDATRSTLQYSATCADDDPNGCTSLQLLINGAVQATGVSSLSGTISLVGRPITTKLVFRGTAPGHATEVERTVYIDPLTAYDSLGQVPGPIEDFAFGRLLYAPTSGSPIAVVRTLASGADQSFDLPADRRWSTGYATPAGGIIIGFLSNVSGSSRLYELRNGITTAVPAQLDGTNTVVVNGSYALYELAGGTLVRRDLSTGTDVTIAAGSTSGDVGANGDVAYTSTVSGYSQALRYRNGVVTNLTQNASTTIRYDRAKTDGVNVIYRRMPTFGAVIEPVLILHDGTSETVLRPPTYDSNDWLGDHFVNGGWTAWAQFDLTKNAQVWVRSPTGAIRQITSFGVSTNVEVLAPDGTVIAINSLGRFIVPPGGTPRSIGTWGGNMIWRDGTFYLKFAKSLWRLRP
jgi:hypothetical protein